MAESVSKFAQDVVSPKVREMDEAEAMDPTLVEQLFEQGLMGVEIPEEYGGAGMNFTAAIVGIEELARVDPSVSILVDVHNTLVNSAFLRFGSAELKKTWLPRLATDTVGKSLGIVVTLRECSSEKDLSVSPNLRLVLMLSLSKQRRRELRRVTRSPAQRCGSRTLSSLACS